MAWLQTSPIFKQCSGYSDVPGHWKAGPEFEYGFLQFGGSSEPAVVDTDVVVVGSGCGGAVCAKVLAEAGYRVLVVDKGYYYPPSQLPMPQEPGSRFLYESGGVLASADSSINILAGACWGGGGTVNWSVSLQTQDYVRQEWARKHGLAFFASQDFQACLDRVCEFMGVSEDGVRQSHRGQVLLDGCKKLGYYASPVPLNARGREHRCGRCHLGCASALKQGPAVSWLPAAAKAGANFMEGFHVERVTFDESDSTIVTGVKGKWKSRDARGGVSGLLEERVTRDVVVKAKKVIVSCGALWSPLVLLKSGLKVSSRPSRCLSDD